MTGKGASWRAKRSHLVPATAPASLTPANALPARDCLVVEDSAHGLAASLAAGIPTVITLSDYTHDEDFEGARMVLHETENLSLDKLRLWHATASTS